MNKTAIKNYAVWARVQLIESAKQKAYEYAITDGGENRPDLDSIGGRLLTAMEKDQRRHLIAEIEHKGYERVIEEAAYTWFNRFTALRFMEVNGYLPSQIRLFTDENGRFKPEILKEAVNIESSNIDRAKVFELIDGQDNEALYKYLLIAQCNDLSTALPRMFEKIANWTELLFPGNLLKPDSVLGRMVTNIPEEDWTDQVQIIGWLYQYYISELKDDTFAKLKQNIKISKDRIPAATQLFTPDWIVRYMVENSLGRIYISEQCSVDSGQSEQERIAQEKAIAEKMGWKYYLPEAEQSPEVRAQLNSLTTDHCSLTTLKLIDPCMGSGHILVYAFEVLMQIYEASGYNQRDAAQSILENNLYGLDIDDRAAQLAYFAVMMKARQYDRRIFSRGIQPNVYAIAESNWLDAGVVDYFTDNDPKLQKDFGILCRELRDAKEYGSILNISQVDFDALYVRIDKVRNDISMFREMVLNSILPLIQVAETMAQKYHVVVTNPPYMGASSIGNNLSTFLKGKYPSSKTDLFAVMMERCEAFTRNNCYLALITQQSWMFLDSFEKLRIKMLKSLTLVNMLHLGGGAFPGIAGASTTAYVAQAGFTDKYQTTYMRLVDYRDNEKDANAQKPNTRTCFYVSAKKYADIPKQPIAYWISPQFSKLFIKKSISNYAISDGQTKTGDNEKYLRSIWEVSSDKIGGLGFKWVIHAKGGGYRKWYGNLDTVINWSPEARGHYRNDKVARIAPEYIWFRKGLSWTLIADKLSVRFLPETATFNLASPSIFFDDESMIVPIIGYLNTKIAQLTIRIANPTINTNIGDIIMQPADFLDMKEREVINELSAKNIQYAKFDWDSYETSWDFKKSPLV